jgi:FAD/FMN-containing dehydrogenase
MQLEDPPIPTTAGALTRDDIAALASQLQGAITLPDDANYDEARSVHIETDARPALIVRAAEVADVVATINFARERQLDLAVRSGGHSISGYSTLDGGMVLDLSRMKTFELDPESRIVRLGAGLTWIEVCEALHPYGLGLTAGDTATVGVGGLSVGGGIGWFVRKYGMTIDRIRSIEVVTADGQVITASANEHPDLFWAMRGGGGNFGVATLFEIEAHPAGMVYGGAIFYDTREAASVLPAYVSYAASAPDELTTMALVMLAPPAPFIPPDMVGKPVVGLAMIYGGDFEEGNRVVDPLRKLGTPIADIVGPMPYPAIFQFTMDAAVKNLREHSSSMMVSRIDDALISALLDAGATDLPSHGALVQLRVLGGAMRRVDVADTAFAHRDKGGMVMVVGYGYEEADAERHEAWVNRCGDAMRPFGTGAYVGFVAADGEGRIDEVYPPATLERLRAVKRRYDSTNFFHHNLNVAPEEE